MLYHKIIRDLREDNDISQQEIADFIGINRVTYNRLENEHYFVKFDYAIKIADFYGISIDCLAGIKKIPEKLNIKSKKKESKK